LNGTEDFVAGYLAQKLELGRIAEEEREREAEEQPRSRFRILLLANMPKC